MKKNKKVLPLLIVGCLVLCLGIAIVFLIIGRNQNSVSTNKKSYAAEHVDVNYKDVVYLPDYFSDVDNYSNTELYSPGNQRLSMQAGELYVDTMGTYQLVLNGSKKIVNMTVADLSGPSVILNQQSSVVSWGEEVSIDPIAIDNVDEKIDLADVKYTVKKRGEEIKVSEDTFVANELGEYLLEFDLKDAADNKAEPVVITCEMPKIITKPVNTKVNVSDEIFVGFVDSSKQYSYDTDIERVTEDGSKEIQGTSFTVDKTSIYKIKQVATCGDETISLDYMYRSDGYMLYDFNDKDISMMSVMYQTGLTATKALIEQGKGDYAIQIQTKSGLGWLSFQITGLEPNTTYDRISFDAIVDKSYKNNEILLSFYNKQGESGHTVIAEKGTEQTAMFSNIKTDDVGTATVYAYVHVPNLEFSIDNLITQQSTAVKIDKGVYVAFSGGAKSKEKAAANGYNILRLETKAGGWSTLKVFATKEAGLRANKEYIVTLYVKCDGNNPAFYEESNGQNEFVLSEPGGKITFKIKTDANGEFEKVWKTIYLNKHTKLTYVEFTNINITEAASEDDYVYGTGIKIEPVQNGAIFTVVDKKITEGENTGKYIKRIEDITRLGFATIKVSATKKAGLKPNASYNVVLDVACDGAHPAFYEESNGQNEFVLSEPGGKITFKIQTDANGEFEKVWKTVYLNKHTNLTYVEFTNINITEAATEDDYIYGTGIKIEPVQNGAIFTVVDKKITEGENTGKYIKRIEDITRQGFATIKVSATKKAGLKPNASYNVVLDVACDGANPAFYEESNGQNEFVLSEPGGKIAFEVKTDANGEFEKVWKTVYLNKHTNLTYVEFTNINITEAVSEDDYVYGTGIKIEPVQNGAIFTVVDKKITEGENAGKYYKSLADITRQGFSSLTVSADKSARLKSNQEYVVTLDIACGALYPGYFEESNGQNEFVIGKPGGTITFRIFTDENGEFTKAWSTIYIQATGSYVDFTGITFTEIKQNIYGTGISITPQTSGAVFDVLQKEITQGEHAGKLYTVIDNISKLGWSTLTISGTSSAGLKPDTEYEVSLDVRLNGQYPAYFQENGGKPSWIFGSDAEGDFVTNTLNFNIVTDENGEFSHVYSNVYINRLGQTIEFSGIKFTEVRRVYGTGITVTPKATGASFVVSEKTFTEGEHVGELYTSIGNITQRGNSSLTISAGNSSGLKGKTEYKVILQVKLDGAYPAYYENSGTNEWILGSTDAGVVTEQTIEFSIFTDASGSFTKTWNNIYVNSLGSTIDFTGIEFAEVKDEHADKNRITVQIKDDAENATNSNANGFYFTTDNDPLAFDSDGSVIYGPTNVLQGGVYVNGELKVIELKKLAAGRYYVDLSNSNITVANGTEVVIFASYYDDNNVVTFESETFTFDGTTWKYTVTESVKIVAGSDFQSGNDRCLNNISNIIAQMKLDGHTDVDGFFFGGDYGDDFTNHATGLTVLKDKMKNEFTDLEDDKMIFIQGNHDDASTTGLSVSGAHDTEKYGVYVIQQDEYSWTGGSEADVQNAAQKLDAYLDEKIATADKRPIFVLTHIPLHYSSRTIQQGDGLYAKYLFDVLNEHAEEGQNIIFMFGHNHSSGFDDYLGGGSVYLTKGDTLYLAQPGERNATPTECELQFTYMNYGYVGYVSSNGADSDTTMTVFEITDHYVKVERYNQEGKDQLKAMGDWNDDQDMFEAADSYLRKTYESPHLLHLSEIVSEQDKGSVYGTGISVTPATNGASFSVTEQRFTEGENLGKTYTRIENITRQGFSKLTIQATQEAGLLPNTEYEVALDVACDGAWPAYYEQSNGNEFILENPGGTITFTITTDENGEFIQAWNTIYIQTSNTYVDFTGITLTPNLGSVYGTGISVTPATNGASFSVTEQRFTEGENLGKTYTRIENITTQGFSKLVIKATQEAGLLPNTEYEVALDVACDGAWPAYYEQSNGNEFILENPGGTITFTITTDENGEFIQAWNTIYIQTSNTYVDFTGITLTPVFRSVYGNGVTITPTASGAAFSVVEKTFEDGANVGKSYTAIENVTTPGWSSLTVAATKDAGLKANTTYTVEVNATMNGRAMAYYEESNGGNAFVLNGASTDYVVTDHTITFTITTDSNGEFIQKWSKVYIKNRPSFYINFTGIAFTEN